MGTYTCKAVNEHGEAQRKIQLMIAGNVACSLAYPIPIPIL